MNLAALIEPWTQIVRDQVPGAEFFDVHTHVGQNDPDGNSQTPGQLVDGLRAAGALGAFFFPMHEPDGYPPANDAVLAAAANDGTLLVPFCRVDPHDDPIPEAERCLAAGARGIKLHPRAERFTLDHPNVRKLAALVNERRMPMLIHAGRGIPALGQHAVELAGEFPDARLILAHAGICDLSWIWRVAPDHPNLLFDTAWWMPADLQSLFSLLPPGQILFASDMPYGTTAMSIAFMLRSALQVGLTPEQIRCITSEQALRIANREPLQSAGPALGEHERASHLLLERAAEFLMLGALATIRGGDGSEMLALARLACDVPEEIDDAPVFAVLRRLLDIYDELGAHDASDRRRLAFLILAASAARTPDVPVPDVAALGG